MAWQDKQQARAVFGINSEVDHSDVVWWKPPTLQSAEKRGELREGYGFIRAVTGSSLDGSALAT